ncbi:MAG: CRTAC1 family protein [Caldilinea sp.]|nr:CRTAC1 family protein [Caldilinea sp.]MDW8440648.1 CRTAC1 family protein [Caldilineaceae bacterium]
MSGTTQTMALARFVTPLIVVVCLCSAQAEHDRRFPAVFAPMRVEANTVETSWKAPPACSDAFVAHRLDFIHGARLREISTYISNGAGVAVNDLDNDGDLDLVFASVDGQSAILWNEGGLRFTQETLDARFTRGVATVDVDGDGWTDIVFTHRGLEPPSFWRNLGGEIGVRRFERHALPGVDHYAYAMAWSDIDGDGALDLVTGSYGAELKQHGILRPESEPKAGVVLYLQKKGAWEAHRLDERAETLSIAILDLTGDGRPEIWAANDFALEDKVWTQRDEQWVEIHPFNRTSHSTMAIEWGDIDNSGRLALFTTDMNPYDTSPRNLARWLPVINQLGEYRVRGDVQIMANVLLLPGTDGRWNNQAVARGVDASGWSWAAKYGDLDQDGYLDLYVVNGMIAADLFGHLPNGELVEENQAYRNRGDGRFAAAPQWGLNATASGRGMVMADLDDDGDLDIVVNNLRSFAQIFENQLCTGESIQVDLIWRHSLNRRGVGAQITLYTDRGTYRRDVRASGGYLSGDPVRVHIGFPAGTQLHALEVRWPDGAISTFKEPTPNRHIHINRQPTTSQDELK